MQTVPLQDVNRFRCNRHALTESLCVVTVAGEVDLDTAPTLEAILLAALAPKVSDVIVDLKGVTLLDSTGLSALVKAWQVASERGGTIRLTGAARCVQKVLSITALDQLMVMYDDVTAAVASCGQLSSGQQSASDVDGSLPPSYQALGDRPTTAA
jgi:anti-anti-sigma factor